MILLNGRLVPEKDARISYEDRGYLFGDGIYEMFRIYNSQLFEWKAHMARLARSAAAIALKLPYDQDELLRMLQTLIESEGVQEGTLYIQFTRGAAPRSHLFPMQAEPVFMGFCRELKRPFPQLKKGITAVTVPDIRWLRCDIKSLNLLPNTMAKQQAADKGVDDAIFHRSGTVTECSASNLFIVENRTLYTHPANHLILHGITRAVVLRLARKLELSVQEEAFDLSRLLKADEAFATGTTYEVMPIVEIDGTPIGSGHPGPATRSLQDAFEKLITAD